MQRLHPRHHHEHVHSVIIAEQAQIVQGISRTASATCVVFLPVSQEPGSHDGQHAHHTLPAGAQTQAGSHARQQVVY